MEKLNLNSPPFYKPEEWHHFRRGGITGTGAKDIMSGNAMKVYEDKLGLSESDDLSGILRVQLGTFTEPFNVAWFEKTTGLSVDIQGDYMISKKADWWRMDVDGLVGDDAILECKHMNAFATIEKATEYYYPQIQWYLGGLDRDICYLSVIPGNNDLLIGRVLRDDAYISKMTKRCKEVWDCVVNKTPPAVMEEIKAPKISFDDMREVDMDGNNEWSMLAADFLDNKDAAKKCEDAKKSIKSLVEDDVKLAHGYGVQIKRSKSGSLTLKGL